MSLTRSIAMALLAIPMISMLAEAQDDFGTRQNSARLHDPYCKVGYINKIPIPAKADGPLVELNFEEGDVVNEGDVLALVDDQSAQLLVKLREDEYKEAHINANNDVNLRDAQASEKVALAEYESFKELRREGAIPYWEMEKKRLEAERQALRIELAEGESKVAQVQLSGKKTEYQMAEAELEKRKITSPATGFIEERIVQQGQWVQPGTPVAILIQMDRLRVEGRMNALAYPAAVRKGSPVKITIHQGNGKIEISGLIGYVSMEVDSNGLNQVWAEIENEKIGNDWKFKPGMKAEMVIQ